MQPYHHVPQSLLSVVLPFVLSLSFFLSPIGKYTCGRACVYVYVRWAIKWDITIPSVLQLLSLLLFAICCLSTAHRCTFCSVCKRQNERTYKNPNISLAFYIKYGTLIAPSSMHELRLDTVRTWWCSEFEIVLHFHLNGKFNRVNTVQRQQHLSHTKYW